MKDLKKKPHFTRLPDDDDESDQSRSSEGSEPSGSKKVGDGSSPSYLQTIPIHAKETKPGHGPPQMTRGQRDKYKSLQRQELIDLHLTLSRQREMLVTQMANVSNVILELAEAYHDLNSRTCVPRYFCKLDLLIQVSLATYDRRQKTTSHATKGWSGLLSKKATEKKRKRATIIAEQPKRRSTDLYVIPLPRLRHEVVDLQSDIDVYRRRIALDDRKINLMGERWAEDRKKMRCFRYFYLRQIIDSAITDYRVDRT